ncbi:Rpn family recombination-promoting nuclease/putative transposase [Candidatus Saccharibacteria bacterium]|nr:Rpn family recombination-promoting nuclease/putative transposase [Candidatus Saccharibacteria bacterium]
MEKEVIAAKRWADATIRDNFVFGKTMELYPAICRQLIEIILNVKIAEIQYPEREKTIEARSDGKGIRLDVYVEEKATKRSFDVEMQVTDSDNLAKRVRYYQGVIDIDKLKRGQHYRELGESFIIFICPFDHFKQGRHIYSFRERCDQDTALALKDGSTKIFLSTKGRRDDVSSEVKAFLDYVESGIVSGKFVEDLAAAVKAVKANENVRHDFMTYQMDILEHEMYAEERGVKKGEVRKAEAVALKLIRRGRPFEEIHEDTGLPLQRIQELAKSNLDS